MGCAGLLPTVAAIKAKKDICLANKETLIAGGPFVLPLAHENGVNILPADSEHSAIFQCMQVRSRVMQWCACVDGQHVWSLHQFVSKHGSLVMCHSRCCSCQLPHVTESKVAAKGKGGGGM